MKPMREATVNDAERAPRNGRKKGKKRWKTILRRLVVTVVLLAVLALAGLLGIRALRQEYAVTYDGYTAAIGSITNALSYSGSLQLVNSATYTAGSGATVRSVYVAEGDRVQAGDKLMRLSSGETVTAGFDGTVNQVYAAPGDEVNANASLVQLADFTHMKVSLRIDEYDIAQVGVGTACRVTTTATSQTFDSEISSINYISSSTGSVASYTATVLVEVGDGIYPGMQVTVTIPQEEAENVVVLKEEALSFTDTNSAFVYMKAADGTMTEVPVEVGVSNGNYVEIRSGLREGDTVYAVAKTTTTTSGGLLSGLFGSMPMGNMGAGTPRNAGGYSGEKTNRNSGDFGGDFGGAPGRN